MASATSPSNHHHHQQQQRNHNDSFPSLSTHGYQQDHPRRPRHQQRSHFHRDDTNPWSSTIYVSDDEEERRVLDALAMVDMETTDFSTTMDDKVDAEDEGDNDTNLVHDNNSKSNSNSNNFLDDEDAFLAKLRQFKETIRQTTTTKVNPTTSVAYAGDDDAQNQEENNHETEEEEGNVQSLPRSNSQPTPDAGHFRMRLSNLEVATATTSHQQSLFASNHASPSLLPRRSNSRRITDAPNPSMIARSFAGRAHAVPPSSTLQQPQHASILNPNLFSNSKTKSHQPLRASIVLPSAVASTSEQQQQATALRHSNIPASTSTITLASSMTADNNVSPWVRKFLSTRPKDCLMLVPRDYLLDNFNLARLPPVVDHLATLKQQEMEAPSPNVEQRASRARAQQQQQSQGLQEKQAAYPIYRQALDLILGQDSDKNSEHPPLVVQYAAEVLYCLVHARFVVSPRGLDTIRSRMIIHGSHRINQPLFGRCPRIRCRGMPLLPCGLSDDYDPDGRSVNAASRAKRYCCNCRETFHFWESKVQGCAWAGMSLCHLLLLVYGKDELFPSHFLASDGATSESNPNESSNRPSESGQKQEFARVFGFPIHPHVAQSW